jgi:hypothetical protein
MTKASSFLFCVTYCIIFVSIVRALTSLKINTGLVANPMGAILALVSPSVNPVIYNPSIMKTLRRNRRNLPSLDHKG